MVKKRPTGKRPPKSNRSSSTIMRCTCGSTKPWEFNHVHRDILHTMDKKLTDGVNIHYAIKRAVAKHKPEFEGLFLELDEDSDEDPEEKTPIPAAPGWPKGKRFSHARIFKELIKNPY